MASSIDKPPEIERIGDAIEDPGQIAGAFFTDERLLANHAATSLSACASPTLGKYFMCDF